MTKDNYLAGKQNGDGEHTYNDRRCNVEVQEVTQLQRFSSREVNKLPRAEEEIMQNDEQGDFLRVRIRKRIRARDSTNYSTISNE